jgi:hypothetical protein
LLGSGYRELRVAVKTAGTLRRYVVERIEIVHMGCDLRAVSFRAEPVYALDGGPPRQYAFPQAPFPRAERRNCPYSRDNNPPGFLYPACQYIVPF